MPNSQIRIGERSNAVRPKVAALRTHHGDRSLVLTSPGSVNWITGGLSDPIDITAWSDPVWAIESNHGRALVTSEIEAPRLLNDYDLDALGWDVITVPWFESHAHLRSASRFCGAAPEDLLSDTGGFGTNVITSIVSARMTLSDPEQDDLRALGAVAAHALETGIDAWRPGMTSDYEIASVISGELERHGAKAVCLIVGGDDRLQTLRHPLARVHDEAAASS